MTPPRNQAPRAKKGEWLGAVLVLALLVGGVLAWRWLGGGKQGDDCTAEGMCSLGHICIQAPGGPGRICAATCETDGDCPAGRCVPFESRNRITGTRSTHVVGPDHVCIGP